MSNSPNTPLEIFDQWSDQVRAQQPAWLFPLRKAGLMRFAELGFPTARHEDWRFTNLDSFKKLSFRPILKPPARLQQLSLENYALQDLKGIRLVFVDGHFAPEHSDRSACPAGVIVASLAESVGKASAHLDRELGRTIGQDGNPFASLNTAFFTDGAYVQVPAGQHVEPPIHLIFLSTGAEAGGVSHPRNLFLVGANAGLTVIESYLPLREAAYVTNTVSEFVVGESCRVEHLRFQDESREAFHFGNLHAQLGPQSNVVSHSFALGGKLSRCNIRTHLAGEGLECILNGLYLCHGEQLADHHMIVNHAAPHCASHEYFNGVLADKSRGVFHGRILVQPDAQKTDAKQTNKNVLLSDEAIANSKPQLEIYADDVKCTHGATIGRLDADAIFYMKTRGIPEDSARRMLMHAFAGEIVDRIRFEPARERIDKLVWDRLETHAGKVASNGHG